MTGWLNRRSKMMRLKLAIPAHFYTNFRVKTTVLAFATGCLVGLLSTRVLSFLVFPFMNRNYLYLMIPIGGMLAVIINQISVHSYINGKMRGAFEYVYRESKITSPIDMEIRRRLLYGQHINLELESLSIFKEIMARAENYKDEEKFIGYLAAAHAANAGSEYKNEITALKQAVILKPNDLVANYRLARAYERIGSAQDAIKTYEVCLGDPLIDSEELRRFLISQAERVKEKGPQQGSPIPGIIYQLM